MATKAFRNLEVWQLSIPLVKKIYLITTEFPTHELYTLSAQMRRSAISAPSNIAEGSRRRSTPEFIRFLNISLGSLAELETQIVIAHELGYIREDQLNELLEHIDTYPQKWLIYQRNYQ
jgi:four helix bundle protein